MPNFTTPGVPEYVSPGVSQMRPIGPGASSNLATQGDVGVGSGSIFAARVATIAELKGLNATTLSEGDLIWVDSYLAATSYRKNRGQGGGVFEVVISTDAEDEGHLFAPNTPTANKKYWRQGCNPLVFKPVEFGAIGNGTTSDQVAFEAMIDAAYDVVSGASGSNEDKWAYGVVFDCEAVTGDDSDTARGWVLTDRLEVSARLHGAIFRGPCRIYQTDTTKGFFRLFGDIADNFPVNTIRQTEFNGFNFVYKTNTSNAGAVVFDFHGNGAGGKTNFVIIKSCYYQRGFRFCQSLVSNGSGYASNINCSHIQTQGCSGALWYSDTGTSTTVTFSFGWTKSGGMVEPIAYIGECSNFAFSHFSFESLDNADPPNQVEIVNCGAVTFINHRWEYGSLSNGERLVYCTNTSTTLTFLGSTEWRNNALTGTTQFVYQFSGSTDIIGGLLFFNVDTTGTNYVYDTSIGASEGTCTSHGTHKLFSSSGTHYMARAAVRSGGVLATYGFPLADAP